jgi:hypothetical protein
LGKTGTGKFLQAGLDSANQIDPLQQIAPTYNSPTPLLWGTYLAFGRYPISASCDGSTLEEEQIGNLTDIGLIGHAA